MEPLSQRLQELLDDDFMQVHCVPAEIEDMKRAIGLIRCVEGAPRGFPVKTHLGNIALAMQLPAYFEGQTVAVIAVEPESVGG